MSRRVVVDCETGDGSQLALRVVPDDESGVGDVLELRSGVVWLSPKTARKLGWLIRNWGRENG